MLRLCVFKGREDVLLVHAGEYGVVRLPPLTAPFSKAGVAEDEREMARTKVRATVARGQARRFAMVLKCMQVGGPSCPLRRYPSNGTRSSSTVRTFAPRVGRTAASS